MKYFMNENSIDEERLRQFFKENSPVDVLYTEEVFTNNKNESQLKQILENQFDELAPNESVEKNLDHIFYRIYYNITSSKSGNNEVNFRKIITWTYRVASVLLIPVVLYLGIHLYRTNSTRNNYWVEIKAPAWTRAQFSLPDGTTGWLNSNSGIRYKGNFINERTVLLNGEAYFDVARNPEKHFIVQTSGINVKVLGTRFNITSYQNENNIEIVLEEGKLVFGDKALNDTYTMKPNELLVYKKADKRYSVQNVHSAKIYFMDGRETCISERSD
ncbi:MAG: FecR domain-containing protein [Bacteroidales bacterium]|nr:FecR domain-containing protein [Bacteroidales bacterium]